MATVRFIVDSPLKENARPRIEIYFYFFLRWETSTKDSYVTN